MKCHCEPFQACDLCDIKLKKPGPKKKKKLSTKRFLQHNIEPPEDRRCRNCGIDTGTECYHHPESTRIKMLCGGGIMGGKNPDRLSAWLCSGESCGVEFDLKPDKAKVRNEGWGIDHEAIVKEHDLFTYDCIVKTWLIEEW